MPRRIWGARSASWGSEQGGWPCDQSRLEGRRLHSVPKSSTVLYICQNLQGMWSHSISHIPHSGGIWIWCLAKSDTLDLPPPHFAL